MRSLVVFLYLTISWVEAQNGRGPQHQDHTGHGWDIRLAVPGEPGNDYPTLGAIPRTTFSCAGREPGYYADLETNCQVFRVCTVGSTYGFQSFLCPNGTLFNQAVFVCDWWMNVDCQNSQQFFTNNDQKFENLRLGPELMKDIKKMLTHPMRNPLDKSAMKSNLIVMQDYKPPSGQLFPNGALLAGPERPPNNVYVPSKLINQFGQNNLNDVTFSASTPEPRYLSGQLNSNPLLSQSNADAFQRQRQDGQYNIQGRTQSTQTLQSGNLISNGHAGRYVQNTGLNNNGYSQLPRPTQNTFSQTQPSITNTGLSRNTQRGGLNRPRAQYTEPRKLSQPNDKQNNFGASLKSQNQNFNNQDKQTSTSVFPQFSNVVDTAPGRELKQNLVSTIQDVSSTVATKATTYTVRVQQTTKTVKPKPRITVKTWIVKPTKLARLVANPTPYTYPRPTEAPNDRLVEDTTPYVYDRPTGSSTEKIISVELDTESEEPYIYTKPTPLPKQISSIIPETTPLFIAPTSSTIKSKFSERANLRSGPSPTMSSRLYLTPPTFMTNDRFYLPPPRNPTPLSRQYLPPNLQPVYYESAQLKATPTISSPTYVSYTSNSNKPTPSPSISNFNNMTFTDVLTKEKLDITVNDIVKDRNDILRTASPAQYGGEFNSIDSIENDYSPTRTTTESGENLTSQSPFKSKASVKSSRLIATLSPDLQPPKETLTNKNTNRLSELPFFKESSLPKTIERTVSIKITIPERIAAYFFKNNTDDDFDKLEILNTGSSNYLVLSNNLLTKDKGFNFIPIAKLNGNKNNNISNSQALVYSFLADSINVAREYNNIATQEVLSSTPATSQFQNMNTEDLSQITNKVSQLTSSQFSSNHFNNLGNQANIVSTQTTSTNPATQFRSNARYTEELNQPRQVQSSQYNRIPSQQTQQLYSSQLQATGNTQTNLNNQVYSGQLYQWPVPDVTDQIYNRPISAELLSSHQRNTQMNQQSANLINAPNFQQNPNFEVVKAKTIPFNPTKLHLEPPSAPTPFTSQETLNLLNGDNGISAHLQDKIVGTIGHPSDANKRVTYKKDQSYYLYTKLEDNTIEQNNPRSVQSNNDQQNAKLTQGNAQNHLAFELVPSVSYELEDEKEQEKILNTFRIDEFGAPREITREITTNNAGENINERKDVSANAELVSVENQASHKQTGQYRINALYDGPSSYSAPQSSVGSLEGLEARQVEQNNFSSRLEDLDNNSDGYPKERPAREFTF